MLIQSFVYPGLAIQSYLITDENSKKCAVIDAPRVVDPIKQHILAEGLTLEAILETHVHADFISGAKELKAAFGNRPKIYCSVAGGKEWLPAYADVAVNDGDDVALGAVKLKALHTPGHTPEHISWLCFDEKSGTEPVCAFTGDFLFVQGIGRPDLLGSAMQEKLLLDLHASVFQRLAPFADGLKILPSHGAGSMCGKSMGSRPSTTLGEERKSNAAFKDADIAKWKAGIQAEMPAPPKAFPRNKKLNLTGVPLLAELPPNADVVDKAGVLPHLQQGWIIDFREPEAFARSHLLGAVNVPFSPAMGNWLAGILPAGVPLLCVLSSAKEKERVWSLIRTLGYDQPLAFMVWDDAMDLAGSTTTLEVLHPHDLNTMLHGPNNIFILDVRTPAEWNAGHLRDAQHIELNAIENLLDTIPRDQPVVALCGSGWRSSIAASLLKKNGFKKVSHLWGGMTAWQAMSSGTV